MRAIYSILTLTVLFSPFLGCQSPSISQLSADTYLISKSSSAGAFTNMAKLRASVIHEANQFAESKGKVAVAISAEEKIPSVGFPTFEYQFRLLDKDDPRAQGASLTRRADMLIERNVDLSRGIGGTTRRENISEESIALSAELSLFDSTGAATAYIAKDLTIYLWSGEPVAYLEKDDAGGFHIYGFNGKHLGWFVGGIVRDNKGEVVGAVKQAFATGTKFESFKSFKQFKPFKAFKEFAPFRPFFSNSWSDLSFKRFLLQGVWN